MRKTKVERNTTETRIVATVNLDGEGKYEVDTGCGFLDHMLELFARHGRFDIEIRCVGDTHVDDHHTVEDVAIVLGKAFDKSLGDKAGIVRYGNMLLPMDEALLQVALDISGRVCLLYNAQLKDKVGSFDTELVEEFLNAFVRQIGMTLHVNQLAGTNTHHIIEGIFKGLARALAQAVEVKYGSDIPSTKGVIG